MSIFVVDLTNILAVKCLQDISVRWFNIYQVAFSMSHNNPTSIWTSNHPPWTNAKIIISLPKMNEYRCLCLFSFIIKICNMILLSIPTHQWPPSTLTPSLDDSKDNQPLNVHLHIFIQYPINVLSFFWVIRKYNNLKKQSKTVECFQSVQTAITLQTMMLRFYIYKNAKTNLCLYILHNETVDIW